MSELREYCGLVLSKWVLRAKKVGYLYLIAYYSVVIFWHSRIAKPFWEITTVAQRLVK